MSDTRRLKPAVGGLFRHNYLRPALPVPDSPRARRRLAQIIMNADNKARADAFVRVVKSEIGVQYPFSYGWDHTAFWEKSEIGDALSAITIWHRITPNKEQYRDTVARIFREEYLRYQLDEEGGVHFLIDEEFENVVAATIAGLGAPRFTASLDALQEGLSNLGAAKQSGKGLIRGVFEAVESAFLVIIAQPSVKQLNSQAVNTHLLPILLERHADYAGAEDMVGRLLDSFVSWVKTAHPYRHGTAAEQAHEAPLDIAILSATQGMGFLRYLVGR